MLAERLVRRAGVTDTAVPLFEAQRLTVTGVLAPVNGRDPAYFPRIMWAVARLSSGGGSSCFRACGLIFGILGKACTFRESDESNRRSLKSKLLAPATPDASRGVCPGQVARQSP